MKNLPNILIIIACTFLMQYHSIDLWSAMVGEGFIAYLWSLTLESVALWLWYLSSDWSIKGTALHILAITTSSVVILTAFLKLSEPVTAEITKVDTNTKMQALNDKGVEVFGTALKGSTKYGNHKVSEASVTEAQKAMDSQRSLIAEEKINQDKDKLVLEFSVQAVALFLLMLAQIIAVSKIRNNLARSELKEQNQKKEEHEVVTQRTEQKQIKNTVPNSENMVFAEKLKTLIENIAREKGHLTPQKFLESIELNRNIITKLNYVIDGKGGLGLEKMREVENLVKSA